MSDINMTAVVRHMADEARQRSVDYAIALARIEALQERNAELVRELAQARQLIAELGVVEGEET